LEAAEGSQRDAAHTARVTQAYSEALAGALAGLAGEASCDTYLGEIIKALAAQLGEESASLWLCDAETGEYRLRVEFTVCELRSNTETDHPGADPHPPGGEMLLRFMERAASYDVERAPELEAYRDYLRQRGILGLLVVPLTANGRTIGTIGIRSFRRRSFSPQEIELAQALAHQATLAFQLTRLAAQARKAATASERERAAQERAASLAEANAALQAEIRERERADEALRRSEEALRRTLSFLASEPPLDQFLGHVLGTVTGQLSAAACTLWFHDPAAHVFRIHMGFEDGQVRMGQLDGRGVEGPETLEADRDALLEVVRTRRPVVLNNVSENPRLEPHRAWLQARGVKAVLLAPLVAGETLLGVIGIHNTERDTWRDEQAELAVALAGQASLAVQLTRLAEQARRVVLGATSVAAGLHSEAERAPAELIVVGSSHRGPVGRATLGTHATRVIHGAPCSVAIAPHGLAAHDVRLRLIGVALDGSPESYDALGLARRLAGASGAAVKLVSVLPPRVSDWGGYQLTPGRSDDDEIVRKQAQKVLAVARPGEETEIRAGDVRDALVDLSGEVDLLVMGSRSYGPARRILLGSVSDAVVRAARCPIVVLPRSSRDGEAEPVPASPSAAEPIAT